MLERPVKCAVCGLVLPGMECSLCGGTVCSKHVGRHADRHEESLAIYEAALKTLKVGQA